SCSAPSGLMLFHRGGTPSSAQSKIQNPKSKILTFSLALLAFAVSPALAHDVVALLRRGDRAERASRYSGVKQIWACCSGPAGKSSDYRRSVRIWHDGPGRTRLEFLREQDGPARVVVENGSHRWFFSPRHRCWRAVSWREPQPRLNLLLKNYRV